MVRAWFQKGSSYYNDFIKALLKNDLDAMNDYMNHVALSTFSYFDTGERPSPKGRLYCIGKLFFFSWLKYFKFQDKRIVLKGYAY